MGIIAILLGFFPKLGMLIAVIPSPVLNGATVILFGMIAFSGVQHLKDVEWDDMNVITAAVPYIIAIVPSCRFYSNASIGSSEYCNTANACRYYFTYNIKSFK